MTDVTEKPVPALPDPKTLSETQRKVLRILARNSNWVQLSGNGMAPVLAGANALVRKGVIGRGDGSHYYICKHARQYALDILQTWRVKREAEKAAAAAAKGESDACA